MYSQAFSRKAAGLGLHQSHKLSAWENQGPSGYEHESENRGLGSSGWVSKGGHTIFEDLNPAPIFTISSKHIAHPISPNMNRC